ncbi:MAG: MATE family efflux transporter [Bacillus sp. (in: firmicutes)]
MVESTVNLKETPVKKVFLSYLIPSIVGMLLMSVNILVDGIFVSQGVGENALAGVNIAVPIYSILLSISLWVGMGGATLYSISLGKNKVRQAQSIFTLSVIISITIVGLLILLGLWKETELAYFFGANEHILPYVVDYLHIILLFGLIFMMENILSIFVRNDGNPKLAMMALIITAVLNIVFNYIFIFALQWGVEGAAYATVLATAIGFFVLATHFLRKQSILQFVKIKLDWMLMRHILNIGFPSFIVEGATAILTMGYNIAFMHFTGELGVTSFAVVNYIHVMMLLVFIGVGAALQPIASFHYGARLFSRLHSFLRLAIITAIGVGGAIVILGWSFGELFVAMFGIQSQEVYEFTIKGMSLFFIGYFFMGYNVVYIEFFQATRKIRLAVIIVLMKSTILLLPLLWILPQMLGETGIWLALPVSEGITALGLWIWNRHNNPIAFPNGTLSGRDMLDSNVLVNREA